jgi:putative peptidoglycan lipid II flippase
MDDLKDSLSQGLRLIFFISIPAMAGLIILRVPIVRMLFQRGVFTADATLLTANALFYFTIGLWAVAGVRVVVNVFYALQDIWTPVKVAMLSILCNLVMSVVLMKPLQHAGLALAVSLSSMLNLVVLLSILRIRLGKLGIRKGISSFAKTIVSSAVMGSAVHFTYHGKFWLSHRLPAHEGVVLMASIVSGVMVFFLCSYLLKSEELLYLWKNARRGKSG